MSITLNIVPFLPRLSGQVIYPSSSRGPMVPSAGLIISRGRLSTDSIGTATITFTGVQANSEIRLYLSDGTEQAGIEDCTADQVLACAAYLAGSANNTVRVVVIHPLYKIKEFTYTVSVGAQTLPIQQEPDKWYSNPV